jgi:Domain of unknown function (DUF1992)
MAVPDLHPAAVDSVAAEEVSAAGQDRAGRRNQASLAPAVAEVLLVRRKTMSFQKNVDEKIKESIAGGEFDNLPGKGKPLDLDVYFAAPEHLRMGYSILKNADIIPEEMELLKQIENLKKSLISCTGQIEKRAIQKQLSEKITDFNMRIERYRRKRS